MLTWYEIVGVGCFLLSALIFVIMAVVADVIERKIAKRLKERGIIE